MAQAKGSASQVIIQQETTFGVDPVAPNAQLLHFSTCGLKMSRALERSDAIQPNRNPSKPARGNIQVGGNLNLELQAYIGLLLKGALGSVTTTGAASPYTHTFKVGTSLPSFLIEKGFTDIDQYFKYRGCKINRMSFNLTPSGFQKIDFDIMGAEEVQGTASFDTTPTNLGKSPFDGFAIATIEEGGSAIANVVGIDNLSIENNLDGDMYLVGGAGKRAAVPEGSVVVTGTLKALFENVTLYNKAVNYTESSLKIVYQLGTGDGSAGNEYLEFFIPELLYAPDSPPIEGPRGVLVSLPFEAYYDNNAQATALQVILKNTQETI